MSRLDTSWIQQVNIPGSFLCIYVQAEYNRQISLVVSCVDVLVDTSWIQQVNILGSFLCRCLDKKGKSGEKTGNHKVKVQTARHNTDYSDRDKLMIYIKIPIA